MGSRRGPDAPYHPPMPDAIVIGGGPAGSVAATLLARGGWAVTLVEAARFPRDKVCGECLSPTGVGVLRRVGLAHAIIDAGRVELTMSILHAADGGSAAVPLREASWGISRRAMDPILLDAARVAGAVVIQPARVEQVQEGNRPRVAVRRTGHSSVEWLEAEVVLIADGKGGAWPAGKPVATGDMGIKTHFAGVDGPRDAIELFAVGSSKSRGHYGGLAAVEGDRWNAAFSVPAERLRAARGDVAAVFSQMVEENPTLSRRLRNARQVSPWLSAPLPRFGVRRDWPAGLIPVGNAAAALEPVGGEGMGVAMASAEAAANGLLSGRSTDLPHRFLKLWRTRRPACRAAAVLLSSSASGAAVSLVEACPALGAVGLRLIGKS